MVFTHSKSRAFAPSRANKRGGTKGIGISKRENLFTLWVAPLLLIMEPHHARAREHTHPEYGTSPVQTCRGKTFLLKERKTGNNISRSNAANLKKVVQETHFSVTRKK